MAVTMHAYSTNPEAVPGHLAPEALRGKQRRGGLYKMNYFLKVHDAETGEKRLEHVGYYTMFQPPEGTNTGANEVYMQGVVEGVTSLKDLPEQKGRFMFC